MVKDRCGGGSRSQLGRPTARAASPAGAFLADAAGKQERTSIKWGQKQRRSVRAKAGRFPKVMAIPPATRDSHSFRDAQVQVESPHSQQSQRPVKLVLKVVGAPPARSHTRDKLAEDAKELLEDNERLRKQLFAEDSTFKKELKTLKRKLSGVVAPCEEAGVTVPGKFMLPKQRKAKKRKTNVNKDPSQVDDKVQPRPNEHSFDSACEDDEFVGGLVDGHASAAVAAVAAWYVWQDEMEAASREEFREHAATTLMALSMQPSEPSRQIEERANPNERWYSRGRRRRGLV